MGDQAQSHIHSTGRGGAGNIGEDNGTYVDGDIVREGVAGEGHGPEYSSGRGGVGNMVPSPRTGTPVTAPSLRALDIVPETATRPAEYENFHTGRGGEGNVHREKYGGHSGPQRGREGSQERVGHKEGLVEKARHLIGLDKHHKHEQNDTGEVGGAKANTG